MSSTWFLLDTAHGLEGGVGVDPRTQAPTTSLFYTDPGITEDVGVDLWPNAGSGNDFTQATGAKQPTLGVGVIADGSDDEMASTSTGLDCFDVDAGTVVLAANRTSSGSNDRLFHCTTGFHVEVTAGGALRATLFDGAAKRTPDIAFASGDLIVSVKFDGTDLRLRMNGGAWQIVLAGNGTFLAVVQGIFDGGTNAWPGALYDLSTWDTVRTDDQISDTELFVNDAYSLGLL